MLVWLPCLTHQLHFIFTFRLEMKPLNIFPIIKGLWKYFQRICICAWWKNSNGLTAWMYMYIYIFCSINNHNNNKIKRSAAVKCSWHEIHIERMKEKAACLLWINGNILCDLMIILWLWQLSIHIKRFLYTFAHLCSPSLVHLTTVHTHTHTLKLSHEPKWQNNKNSSNPVALLFDFLLATIKLSIAKLHGHTFSHI